VQRSIASAYRCGGTFDGARVAAGLKFRFL